jgi:hypothetical protein
MFNHSTKSRGIRYLCDKCHPVDCTEHFCRKVLIGASYLCAGCDTVVTFTVPLEPLMVADLGIANRLICMLRRRVERYKTLSCVRAKDNAQLRKQNKELKEDLRDYVAGLCDLCGNEMLERLASPDSMTLEQFNDKYD